MLRKFVFISSLIIAVVISAIALNSHSKNDGFQGAEVVSIPLLAGHLEKGLVTPASCGVTVQPTCLQQSCEKQGCTCIQWGDTKTVDYGHTEWGGACEPPPPPPCGSGSVSGWSQCSASCGGGTQSRTITRPDCSTYQESQSCNTQLCLLTASLSANPDTINRNQQSTLSWTSSYADWCDITNDVGPDIGRVEPNGSRVVTLTETTAYTLTCFNANGIATSNATVTVRPLPTVDLQGSSVVELPDPVNLTWFTQNADSCTASRDWSGSKSTPNGSESLNLGRGDYTFKLCCTGPGGGSVCDTQDVRVTDVPRCDFSTDSTSIIPPQTAFLSWSCSGGGGGGGGGGTVSSCEIDQGIGNVGISGSLEVRPSITTTYTLECIGRDGSKSFSTTIGVGFIPKLKEVLPRP